MDMKYVEVQRHSLFIRFVHWSIVITGIILALSGMELGGLYGVRIFGENVLAIHITVAFVFGCLWGMFGYYMIAKEWKWISLGRIPYSIKFFYKEALAWCLLGPHVEDPRGYSLKKKDYVEKIVPTQVMVWWIYVLLALLMGITGFAMYYPEQLKPIVDLAQAIGSWFNPAGQMDGYTFLRALHRLGMYLFGLVMFMHMYAVVIFGVLPSMFTGKRREKVVEE
jgi:formate dehydrogenase subunit gamma